MNSKMTEPLLYEVIKCCKHWWRKTQRGENWFGRRNTDRDLMMKDPDAFLLLMFVRNEHWWRDEFYPANEACTLMPGGGWTRKRFAGARSRLIGDGYLEVVRPATIKPKRAMVLRLVKIDHL